MSGQTETRGRRHRCCCCCCCCCWGCCCCCRYWWWQRWWMLQQGISPDDTDACETAEALEEINVLE